jgi:hypothetical protein
MGKQTEFGVPRSKMTFEQQCLLKAHNEIIERGGKGIINPPAKSRKDYSEPNQIDIFKPKQKSLWDEQ